MFRLFALIYGAFCYFVFLVTFLYAIGFVAGFGVPKHIDNGASGTFAMALVVDLALLALFAIQHSGMARPGFKRCWTKIVPPAIERSTYVLVSSLALIALFWWWRPLGPVLWNVEHDIARIGLHAISAFGWLMVLSSTFLISHLDLFGLKQVWQINRQSRDAGTSLFVTRAFYRIVRHPLMLGFLIAFWVTPTMSLGHLLFALMTTGYIVIAVKYLEERDLVAEFGDVYRDYQDRVPMLLPLPKRSKARA